MFKLYYSVQSCGAANFITASLAGLDFTSEQVNISTKQTASGGDFRKINPKGNVPAIVLPNGTLLNENVATLTYLADLNPSANLAPREGDIKRYSYLNALGFVATELHQAFGPLFNPALSEDEKKSAKEKVLTKVKTFSNVMLAGKEYLLGGSSPTAADIYAYIVLSWAPYAGVDISEYKDISAYSARIADHPGVKEAHKKMNAAPQA